jgi:hypothetical protein
MDLPVMPPVRPMLGKLVYRLPEGMRYEPRRWRHQTSGHLSGDRFL